MDYTAKENFQEGNLTRDKEPALSLPNEKWAQKLKQELVVSGYSTKTMKMYLCYFNEFARAIKKPVEQAERDDVMAFLAKKKRKEMQAMQRLRWRMPHCISFSIRLPTKT